MTDAPRNHVIVVDDERDLTELLSYNLVRAGYDVSVAHGGRAALDLISSRRPDLVLLDIMLPELSGTEIAGRIRANPATASIPIIMLTAKTDEMDQLVGLTVGADDYITKPFSMRVVLARVEAVLRRSVRNRLETPSLMLGAVRLDLDTHDAFVHDVAAKLTLTEFRLLATLVHAAGRVQTRAALMARVMGPDVLVTERTIDVHITAIRRKLGDQGGLIKTVRGVGYRATPELEAATGETDNP